MKGLNQSEVPGAKEFIVPTKHKVALKENMVNFEMSIPGTWNPMMCSVPGFVTPPNFCKGTRAPSNYYKYQGSPLPWSLPEYCTDKLWFPLL